MTPAESKVNSQRGSRNQLPSDSRRGSRISPPTREFTLEGGDKDVVSEELVAAVRKVSGQLSPPNQSGSNRGSKRGSKQMQEAPQINVVSSPKEEGRKSQATKPPSRKISVEHAM